MAARYQVRLKNQAGAVVAIFDDWRRLELSRQVNGFDTHKLEIDGGSDVVDLFEIDGQVEVWRNDLAESIAWYLEYEGFHRTEVRQVVGGTRIYSSYDRGYEDLLMRRIILYAAASAQAAKSGVGETVMKAFVDENAGPGATSPPRLLASGVFTGLTLQADGAAGGNWEGGRAYRNLLDICQEVANVASVDFGIVGNGAALFEFQAQAAPWGDDRTTDGLDPATGLNGAGNVPTIFSLVRGNMANPVYSMDRRSEINAAIGLGQGIEADRVVRQRTNAAAIAESTWNRCEAARQANTESTTGGVDDRADALLEEQQAKESFDFDVLQTPSTLYGRDYFLGDEVTARFDDIERNKKIVGIKINVSGKIRQIEQIAVVLSDVP